MKTTSIQKDTTKRLRLWAGVVGLILMIPLLAKAPWTISDFIFAGVVLFGSATVYEFATRNMTSKVNRIVVAGAVLAFLVLVQAWAAA